MRKSDIRLFAFSLIVVGACFVRADQLVPILDASLDVSRSARGVSLSFVRWYLTATNSCCEKGLLGYGWSDNLTASFRREGPDVLVFPDSLGEGQAFVEVKNKWHPADPGDATELSETSDAYVLKYENGVTRSFSKANSRTSFVQDNQGNSLVFTWDGNELRRVAHTDGQSLTFTYANGLIASVIDDCGRKTDFCYDNGFLIEVKSFDGRITRYKYRAADESSAPFELKRIAYPDGTIRSFEYDEKGCLTSVSDGTVADESTSRQTTITRSDDGVAVIVAPDGGRSILKFGERGEIVQATDALGNTRRYAYSTNGVLESVTAPSGNKVALEHDDRGRIAALLTASGAKTKFSYAKPFGNLERVTDANGQELSYDYDSYGRATSVTFPDGSSSWLSYNARGDMTEFRNRRAQSVSRVCDAQGRVIRMTWPDGRIFQYSYDAHGNLVMAQDSETGVVMMTYDKNDRMTRIAYPGNRGLEFAYDAIGRLVSRKLFGVGNESATAVEKFAYDAEGRLASLSDGAGKSYLVNEYDTKTGRLSKQTYGNGMVVSNAYDRLGRITGIYHGRVVSMKPTNLTFFEYTYDADGRCMASRSQDGWEAYAYDVDGQLTAAFYPNGAKDTFSYDQVGNRKTSGEATYIVNSLNQYTIISTSGASASPRLECLAYDLDGNMVSQKDDSGETKYFYDVLNRLVAVTNETTGVCWSCKYDALGNRVSVTDNDVTTERILIPGVLSSVAAESVDGKLVKRHIVAGVLHVATLTTDHSTIATEYYHGDIIGSVRLVTDENGTEISRSSYTAFGALREGRAPARPGSIGYVGMLGVETDPTGLLFMRNRYYSPTHGRFITPDPIGLAGGDVNWYRYCANASVCRMDINGCNVVDTLACGAAKAVGWTGIGIGILGAVETLGASLAVGAGMTAYARYGEEMFCNESYNERKAACDVIGLMGQSGAVVSASCEIYDMIDAQYGLDLPSTDLSTYGEMLSEMLENGTATCYEGDVEVPCRQVSGQVENIEPKENNIRPSDADLQKPRPKKEKHSAKQRNSSRQSRNQRPTKDAKADTDDDELSPDQMPDPDNDNYVWCEDVCGEEGMRPVCPDDTANCVYWGCSRCGHVIRRKAKIAKRKEREWKAKGIEGVWHGSQLDVRQAKAADE